MSDGSYCHYCQKSPCRCPQTWAVLGPGMSGSTNELAEAQEWLRNNPRAVLYSLDKQRLCPPHSKIFSRGFERLSCSACIINEIHELRKRISAIYSHCVAITASDPKLSDTSRASVLRISDICLATTEADYRSPPMREARRENLGVLDSFQTPRS